MRKLLMLCLLLVALPVQAQDGAHPHPSLQTQIDAKAAQARVDSVIAVLAGHEGRIGLLESHVARLDSLIAALGLPPDTTPDPDPDPDPDPVTGDTAVIIAEDATSVTIEATWTGQPVDETLKTRPGPPRLNVRDPVSPYTFTAPKQAARSLLVAIERWDRSGASPVYLGDDTLAVIDIPASGAPPDTTTPPPQPPPSGGAVPAFAADIAIGSQPGPNEPAGFTQVDPTVGSNWDVLNDYGEKQICSPVDGRCFPVPEQSTDPSFPNNPLLKHTWPTGFGDNNQWPGSAGRSGGTRFHMQTPNLRHTQSYISVRFKFDPNIQLGPVGLKVVGVGSVRSNMISAWILALGNNHRLTFDNKIFCGDAQCAGSPNPIRTSFSFVGNTLYHMEVLSKTNSAAGVPDGQVTIWINGVVRLRRTDIVWYGDTIGRAGDARWLNGTLIDPIPSTRRPAPENWIKYDDLYVSTRQ